MRVEGNRLSIMIYTPCMFNNLQALPARSFSLRLHSPRFPPQSLFLDTSTVNTSTAAAAAEGLGLTNKNTRPGKESSRRSYKPARDCKSHRPKLGNTSIQERDAAIGAFFLAGKSGLGFRPVCCPKLSANMSDISPPARVICTLPTSPPTPLLSCRSRSSPAAAL